MATIRLVAGIIIGFIVLLAGLYFFISMRRHTVEKTAVIREIRELKRWETASYTIEQIIDRGTEGNAFQQFLFGNRILLIAHGEVIAGFDLTNLSEESISIQGNAITISFPPAQILTTRLDSQKTRVYDRQEGFLAATDKDLESEARLSAENAIREAACREGVLEKASENAKKQATSLMTLLGFTTVTILVPESSC